MFLLFITLFTLLSEWVLYQSGHRVEGLFLVKNRRRWWRNRKRKGTKRKREKRGCRGQKSRMKQTGKKGTKGFKYVISSCWYCSFCIYCNFCMCFHFTLSRGKPGNGHGGRVCLLCSFPWYGFEWNQALFVPCTPLVSSYKTKQLWLDIVHVYMLNIFWPDVYTH